MSKEEFIAKFKQCKTYTSFRELVEHLKNANGGYYPGWWYSIVHGSGMYKEVSRGFTDLGRNRNDIEIPGIPTSEYATFDLE
mgnify:CR=1 FL=1